MVADGTADVTLDDFGAPLRAGGVHGRVLQHQPGAVRRQLAAFPGRRRAAWRSPPGALEQFRIARVFRDSMFASGNTPVGALRDHAHSRSTTPPPRCCSNSAGSPSPTATARRCPCRCSGRAPDRSRRGSRFSSRRRPTHRSRWIGTMGAVPAVRRGSDLAGGSSTRFTITFNVGGHTRRLPGSRRAARSIPSV